MSQGLLVYIGIQARSTSVRFPGKVHEKLGSQSILEHVIESCVGSAAFLNKDRSRTNRTVRVALLVPKGDPIAARYRRRMTVLEGDEDDVLSRYTALQKKYNPDYLCRITADCPLIPHFLITKHI
jgi:spore coat polysaccharide biosynthesis protein SpsF